MADGAMETIRDLAVEIQEEERSVLELFAEALQEVSDAVTESGEAGWVSLKLAVKPQKKHGRFTVAIEPAFSRKVPERKLGGVIRFNRRGRLSRNDERQPQLPLRAVEPGQVEARDVAVGAPAAREV